MKKAKPDPYKHSSDNELITDPARITRLLEKLARQKTPLTVRIPGHDERYTSCTVEVERPYVLLDELMPSTGHKLLLRERSLTVSCKLDGVDIRYIASLERVDEQDNLVTYYMILPGQLEYKQRRQHYRVHIPISKLLRVVIGDGKDTVNEGALHDLSLGGAGIIFPVTSITAEIGELCECAFELPDSEWLYCTVEFRYSKSISSQERQLIGARFIDLAPAQTRLIGRCISELEREFIRKRATYE